MIDGKKKVIFVCCGNVCRSTMTQFIFKNILRRRGLTDEYIVGSAGTITETTGMDIHEGTKAKLDEYGIPYEVHSAHKITPEEYLEADYIIAMDQANVDDVKEICGGDPDNKIHKLMEYAGEDKDVPDPYFTKNFDETYDDIIKGCLAFSKAIL